MATTGNPIPSDLQALYQSEYDAFVNLTADQASLATAQASVSSGTTQVASNT